MLDCCCFVRNACAPPISLVLTIDDDPPLMFMKPCANFTNNFLKQKYRRCMQVAVPHEVRGQLQRLLCRESPHIPRGSACSRWQTLRVRPSS